MRRLATLLFAAALLAAGAGSAAAAGFKVIVNKDNPAPGLPKSKVGMMFMKMVSKWDGGAAVEPADQAASSPVRAAFSAEIHGRSVEAIQTVWQRAVFAGRGEPPPELASDAEVAAWVAARPGGIGYVSEGFASDQVKVLPLAK